MWSQIGKDTRTLFERYLPSDDASLNQSLFLCVFPATSEPVEWLIQGLIREKKLQQRSIASRALNQLFRSISTSTLQTHVRLSIFTNTLHFLHQNV